MSSSNNDLIKMITNHTEQLVQKVSCLTAENKKLKQEYKELSDFINNHIQTHSKKIFDTTQLDNIELDMNSYDYFNTSLLFPNIKLEYNEYNDLTDLPQLIPINKPNLELETTQIQKPSDNSNNEFILKKIININRPRTPKNNKRRPFTRLKKIEKTTI